MNTKNKAVTLPKWMIIIISVIAGLFVLGFAIFSGLLLIRRHETEEPAPAKQLSAAEQKKVLYEQKLQEVRDLHVALINKVERLKKTVTQLDAEIDAYAAEVRTETTKVTARNFEKAIQNKRVKQNLEAIQKGLAYKDFTLNESQMASAAIVDAEGTEKQLRIDIIMLAGIDEAELDSLLTKLDGVINKIQPLSKDLVITDEQIKLKPLNEIYKDVLEPPPLPTQVITRPATLPIQPPKKPIRNESFFTPRAIDTPIINTTRISDEMKPIGNLTIPPSFAAPASWPSVSVATCCSNNSPVKSPPAQNPSAKIVNRDTPPKRSTKRPLPPTRTESNERPVARHVTKPKPSFEFEPPQPPEPPEPPDFPTFDSSIFDTLDRCHDALDDSDCRLAQTLCTDNVIKKFSWVNPSLKRCWKEAALEQCQAALEEDNCELAQTLCANAALKDYTWINMSIKACWQFKEN